MEVNVGDHSNRLIDIKQDIDRLQSDTRTANEFVGQSLAKLGNRVQAMEETVRATQDDLQSTQGWVDTVEDTMKAMTLTLRGITDTHKQTQSGWGGMLDHLENLPGSITNMVNTWAPINLRRNQARVLWQSHITHRDGDLCLLHRLHSHALDPAHACHFPLLPRLLMKSSRSEKGNGEG